jgi:hypothetical protein
MVTVTTPVIVTVPTVHSDRADNTDDEVGRESGSGRRREEARRASPGLRAPFARRPSACRARAVPAGTYVAPAARRGNGLDADCGRVTTGNSASVTSPACGGRPALNYEMLLLPRTVRPRSSECAATRGRRLSPPFLSRPDRFFSAGDVRLLGYPGKRHRTGARKSDSNFSADSAALLTSRFIQIACMLTPTSALERVGRGRWITSVDRVARHTLAAS